MRGSVGGVLGRGGTRSQRGRQPYPQEMLLVLISVRGLVLTEWVKSRYTVYSI